MFSKRVIGSARFLRMPGSTQTLYFHLGMAADDDGIVEAYPIMQMVNASEDDLKLLAAKGFVKVLNEDLVTYILDWQENNKIRADRKVNSIYKDLLLQVMPETPLIEPRQRADRVRPDEENDDHGTTKGRPADDPCASMGHPDDGERTTMGQAWDVPPASHGQPRDNHGTQMGQHRLGKDRLVYAAAAARDAPIGDDRAEIVQAFCDNLQPGAGSMVIEQLHDAVDTYGKKWCMEAIREASASGGRSIQYVLRILQRWERDGFKAQRKKGGGGDGTGGIQGDMAGDGTEKSAYAAYLDGDTVKRSPYDLGGTSEEGGDSADDWSTPRGDPYGEGTSSGSGGGGGQANA